MVQSIDSSILNSSDIHTLFFSSCTFLLFFIFKLIKLQENEMKERGQKQVMSMWLRVMVVIVREAAQPLFFYNLMGFAF